MLSDERIRQIADDIYCSEGTRAEIEHSIRAALAEAAKQTRPADQLTVTDSALASSRSDGELSVVAAQVPVMGEANEDIAQLMKFYAVNDLLSLVRVQSEHVARLQKKLPPMRDEQPRNPRSGGE